MPARAIALLSCLFLASADTGGAARGDPADVVLRNGKIYTVDSSRAIKQAIALTGNTIVAVGKDEDMTPLIEPSTKVVDLGGKLVLPCLIDGHIHPVVGAISRARCSLAGVKATIEALKPVIQACLAKEPGGPDDWLEAVQLDNYGFSATARDLDAIEAERPIALEGGDGHTVWVNSRGLAVLGVGAETPDPQGSKIARDASGAPNGHFADSAAGFVAEKLPQPPLEKQVTLTEGVLKDLSSYGITTLMDAYVTQTEAEVWRRLYDTGKLAMRVRMAIHVADPSDHSDEAVARLVAANKAGNVDPDFLQSGIVKAFADSVMEYPAQTAALLSPYLDAEGKPTNAAGDRAGPGYLNRFSASISGASAGVRLPCGLAAG